VTRPRSSSSHVAGRQAQCSTRNTGGPNALSRDRAGKLWAGKRDAGWFCRIRSAGQPLLKLDCVGGTVNIARAHAPERTIRLESIQFTAVHPITLTPSKELAVYCAVRWSFRLSSPRVRTAYSWHRMVYRITIILVFAFYAYVSDPCFLLLF